MVPLQDSWGIAKVGAKNTTGSAKLKVFSGKQKKLNRLALQIFDQKGPLVWYDVWRFVKMTKGYGRTEKKTIQDRVDALFEQGYVAKNGTRPTKPGWPSDLFEITRKGKAALKADKKTMDQFLETASEEELQKFIDIY